MFVLSTIRSMAKVRETLVRPTASTVEAVNVLNGAEKSTGSQPGNGEERQIDVPENPTRRPPRKRNEPPTAAEGPGKLRRPARESGMPDTTNAKLLPHSRRSTVLGKPVRRADMFDHPEDNEEEQEAAMATVMGPPPKKQKDLSRKSTKDHFQDHSEIGLPANSPAKATRSHDKAGKNATTRRHVPRAASEAQRKQLPESSLPQASRQIAEAQSDTPEEQNTSTDPRGCQPPEGSVEGSSEEASPEIDHTTRTSPRQNEVQPASSNEEFEASSDEEHETSGDEEAESLNTETSNETEISRLKKSSKKTKDPQLEEEVLVSIEEAASLYGCTDAWAKVLVYAEKAVQPKTKVKRRKLIVLVDQIESIELAYKMICQNELSEGELDEEEATIEEQTKALKGLPLEFAAANPTKHDLKFAEYIYKQVIPRIAFMMRTALAARFDEHEKDLSIEALEELVGLINITLAFRELAEKIHVMPGALTNGNGELILGLAVGAIASLRNIRKKYCSIIAKHKNEAERAEEARRREAAIAREAMSAAAIQQRTMQERAEAYERKLREEREKKAEAARNLAAKRAEEEQQWKQELMMNGSFEADRLRRKFDLPYRPLIAPRAYTRNPDTVVDIDDFDVEENFEPVRAHSIKHPSTGIRHTRPRPRRELTEDIPAPVIEPKWTDEQIEALVWGLRTFRGRDRYQDILHAPELDGLLRGKSDFDVMQQALYIKQSMTRAMDTGVLPNGTPLEDDWSWLRSV